MKIFKNFIILLLVALASTSISAKNFYRFKNSEGSFIVKDQLTNEMIAVGYDVINQSGRVIKRVGPGKTLLQEEEERLKEIEKKKAEYAFKLKIRSDADLLRQFSSVGDIIRNRDGQLLAIEQRIRIQKSKSSLLKLQLEDQQKQAATHERLGQKIPALLQNDINDTHKQISSNLVTIKDLDKEKTEIAQSFEKDIVRYKELESLRLTLKKRESLNDGTKAITYDCPDQSTCQKAWQLAQIYAKDNASGRIEIITNTLILTSKPKEDTDMALSFSKIPAAKGAHQIVLEVSCNDTEQGADLCKSELAKNMRVNYITTIKRTIN